MSFSKFISLRGKHSLRPIILKYSMIVISLTLCSNMVTAQSYSHTRPSANHIKTTLRNDWTGFYGGVNVGGIFNDAKVNANHFGLTNPSGICDAHANFSSFFPGLQLGYLWQFDTRAILGIEGDFTYNIQNQGNTSCVCDINPDVSDQFTIKNRSQGSLRGRVGYALNNHLLPYFTAGRSLADLGGDYNNENNNNYSSHSNPAGWLAGAGLEWGFLHHWSVRAEYYYVDYGNALSMSIPTLYDLFDPDGSAKISLNTNNVRIALNYWI